MRDLGRFRGLGDVYKRQTSWCGPDAIWLGWRPAWTARIGPRATVAQTAPVCGRAPIGNVCSAKHVDQTFPWYGAFQAGFALFARLLQFMQMLAGIRRKPTIT